MNTNHIPTQTELGMEAGRKAAHRRAAARSSSSPKTDGAVVSPFPPGERIDTSIVATAKAKDGVQTEGIKRDMPPAGTLPTPNAAVAPTSVTTREFLARVLPWPSDDKPGFINMHAMLTTPDGKKPWTGTPTRDIDQFLRVVHAALAWRAPTDVYMCMSRQAKTRPGKDGKERAAKHQDDALALKSIFLDIDVKPKAYNTVGEAADALEAFCAKYNLPGPTAYVKSGGGVHVYWISNRELTPAEWQPYADGLKAAAIEFFGAKIDAGVTGDSARVLRVPGTFNCKTGSPRPVKLLGMKPDDYNFATDLAVLLSIAPTVPKPAHAVANGRPSAKFASLPVESLAEGIKHEPLPPLDWKPIGKQCGWFREAVSTGGKDFSQGLWNLTTLAATFLENGHALAHRMARDHPGYRREETEELWDRKMAERTERGLGWPSCRAIQAEGCKHCTACPHLAFGKSPLNLARIPRPITAPAESKTVHQAEANRSNSNPVAALMSLRLGGADVNALLLAMNQGFAVVKYGGQIVIASIGGNEITFMNEEDFHRMFANLVVEEEVNVGGATEKHRTRLSKRWIEWGDRRQYLGRGVVFDPGGPHEVPNDMLNMWRGFGVVPKPGVWSLMQAHILQVVCSGNRVFFDYLIRWMAYRVQHPGQPLGVAVALLGAQGAGKGIVARTFGGLFGKHFAHITHGDQLTGRFNSSLATSCVVFLDEAFWAGDRKSEGVLKGLITEPTFQLEKKFRDPITVCNRLSIIVASNNDWAVPAGVGDRRWFVLNVANTYAGMAHPNYWKALYQEVENGGEAAMLHDLLAMDLGQFDVRAIPHTAAKAQQQVQSFRGTRLWLYHVLTEGRIAQIGWGLAGLTVGTADAYHCYEEFSKQRREFQPEIKSVWSKIVRTTLGPQVKVTRPTVGATRLRSFELASLEDCRGQFANHVGAPDLAWDEPDEPIGADSGQTTEDVGVPNAHGSEHEPEREPDEEPDMDYWQQYERV
jgi:hypothetical protein